MLVGAQEIDPYEVVDYALREYRARFLYFDPHKKQTAFYEAGTKAKERLFLGGNRTGKTYCGAVEVAMHLAGNYPSWWQGYRYEKPVVAWVATVTNPELCQTLIPIYLGDDRDPGTILPHLVVGRNKALQVYKIRHSSGGVSQLRFKSYKQGRETFQGAKIDIIHFDEEPTMDVYVEGLMRTMATSKDHHGMVLMTMTPLLGMTELMQSFYQDKDEGVLNGSKFYVQASWEGNPHLPEEERRVIAATLPPHERKARELGIPLIGSGLVYPVAQETYLVDPFPVPMWWPHVMGLDFGWTNPTAALVCAINPDTRDLYLIAEYKEPEKTPEEHVRGILKMLGTEHIHVVCDPSGGHSAPTDGRNLVDLYRAAGLPYIRPAANDVEKGLMLTLQLFQARQIKIFRNLSETIKEMCSYSRDKGKVMKRNDHLMDALRYVVLSGCSSAQPLYNPPRMGGPTRYPMPRHYGWMAG